MDVVRALFRALNDEDLDAVAALYHADCITEHVFGHGEEIREGRDSVRAGWAAEFGATEGGLPGGHRFDVTRVAGIETGWGWVRAEWAGLVKGRGTEALRGSTGYSHFWVEDGLVRRHRTIAREVAPDFIRHPRPESERRYPTRPLVGVGAVIFSDAGEVVIVKRRHEPLAGQWSLPGGMLELGETLEAGVAREMAEETGLHVTVGPVVEVFDRILLDEGGRVRYHFVLIDYLCRIRGGELTAGSDVESAMFADPSALGPYRLTEKAQGVIAQAVRMRARSTET